MAPHNDTHSGTHSDIGVLDPYRIGSSPSSSTPGLAPSCP
jgi:hypothetical protein